MIAVFFISWLSPTCDVFLLKTQSVEVFHRALVLPEISSSSVFTSKNSIGKFLQQMLGSVPRSTRDNF